MYEFFSYLIGIPLAFIYKKVSGMDNRITEVETKQEIYIGKVDEVCKSSDKLSAEVHELIGQVKEHLRTTKR